MLRDRMQNGLRGVFDGLRFLGALTFLGCLWLALAGSAVWNLLYGIHVLQHGVPSWPPTTRQGLGALALICAAIAVLATGRRFYVALWDEKK